MDLIKEINEKYQALDAEIDMKLEKVHAEELKLERQCDILTEKSTTSKPAKVLSYEEALQRNANTLKSLEVAKARLRSRTTYSPVEKLLQRAMEKYRNELETLSKQEYNRNSKSAEVGKIRKGYEDGCGYGDVDENEDEEENNLYQLVMQNVLEASSVQKQPGESRRN